MTENDKIISFLLIDNDDTEVSTLKTVITKTFLSALFYSVKDGDEGWDQIQRYHPTIVIADVQAVGLSGIQLIKRTKENSELSDIYFILLTDSPDRAQRFKLMEEGAEDFLHKPFSTDELVAKLNIATRFVSLEKRHQEESTLMVQLAQELENNISEMTLLAVNCVKARVPSSYEMLGRVAEASIWIAGMIDDNKDYDLQDIEIAARFSYVGKLFLPDSLVKAPVMVDGKTTNDLMYNVPVLGKEIVGSVRRFKDVANILYRIYENFDGSGIPGRLKSWQIPIGSRIIRTVLDFEEILINTKKTPEQVVEEIQREAKRLYDHRVVILLEQYLAFTNRFKNDFKEVAVQLQELEIGMTLSRDIITNAGLKLLPSGAILKDDLIKKIFAHNSSDPILGNIFVKK